MQLSIYDGAFLLYQLVLFILITADANHIECKYKRHGIFFRLRVFFPMSFLECLYFISFFYCKMKLCKASHRHSMAISHDALSAKI